MTASCPNCQHLDEQGGSTLRQTQTPVETRSTESHTCYLPVFTEQSGRYQRAACGRWITRAEHSAEPSCDGCKRWLASSAETDAAMEQIAAEPFDPLLAVKPDFFESTAGYVPKGSRS